MAQLNVEVSAVSKVEGDVVSLLSGRTLRFESGARGFGLVMEAAVRLQVPLHFTFDLATSVVSHLLVPVVSQVMGLRRAADGLFIELAESNAYRLLQRRHSEFAKFEQILRQALSAKTLVVVTSDDAGNLVDVRAFLPGIHGVAPPVIAAKGSGEAAGSTLTWRFWPWNMFAFGCYSPTRATEIFHAMAAQSCEPVAAPEPCIPFRYPDDGCHTRAHEMSRLMLRMGVLPSKVWLLMPGYEWTRHSAFQEDNSDEPPRRLRYRTPNDPDCFVDLWIWHCAPTICVRRKIGGWLPWREQMVIDPSLFSGPVSKRTWRGKNPNATFFESRWDLYFPPWQESWWVTLLDPEFIRTERDLEIYRIKLRARSASGHGPPPYAHCAS